MDTHGDYLRWSRVRQKSNHLRTYRRHWHPNHRPARVDCVKKNAITPVHVHRHHDGRTHDLAGTIRRTPLLYRDHTPFHIPVPKRLSRNNEHHHQKTFSYQIPTRDSRGWTDRVPPIFHAPTLFKSLATATKFCNLQAMEWKNRRRRFRGVHLCHQLV